ncbi:ABC transporter ATP-binding protein [Lactococcus fujiensis]|nr:ABC transporter ATP-binding protein [Lactococcus fujiensis]
MNNEILLTTKNVSVAFRIDGRFYNAVYKMSLDVHRGEVLAIVGESGSGKSTFATAIMALHNPKQTKITGSIKLEGEEIVGKVGDQMATIRGKKVGMIFQDPLAALNPLMKIGFQIVEAMAVHAIYSERQQNARMLQLLNQVGIANPERIANQFPHQLSGGMRQRVMIAIAIANNPDLIIADEPTTALDVTIQAQILDLILEVQKKKNAGVIIITHDLGVVAEIADTVVVMYAGQVVEQGPVSEIFNNPKHPYTRSLLRSIPSADTVSDELYVIPGKVPSLNQMEHDKDLFLLRVPWMKNQAQTVISEALAEVSPLHYVRGEAWRRFKFPDQKKEAAHD